MATQLYTYNSFIDTVETSFATPHLQVQKFEEGFYDDMQSFETEDEQFPFQWIVPTSYEHTENSSGIYNIRVYFLDLLDKDLGNERDILSDTASMARDFTNWVRLNEDNGFNLIGTPTSIPVKSVLLDYTAGWYTDYNIELTTEGSDCAIPFIGISGGTSLCPDGTVFNSGSTYTLNVPSGSNLLLPNIPNVDSDGTIVLTPAQTPFTATTCDPVTEQINGVTIGTTPSGGINNQVIENTTGGTVGTAANPSIVSDSTVTNSNGTYSNDIVAEDSLVLPDTNIFSTSSGFTDTTPSVSSGYTIDDNVWVDSDGTTTGSTEYGTVIQCTVPSGLTNPPSFADANALMLGDGNMTTVGGLLDIWENEGTDGNDMDATSSSNRIPLAVGLGANGYRDLLPDGDINFFGTGFNTAQMSQFTLEGVYTMTSNWNPERIGPSIGDVNQSNYPALCWLGNGGFRVTQRKTSFATATTYWSRAAMGIVSDVGFSYTLVYDGTEASNVNRLKLYVNGVFIASTTTPTRATSYNNANGRVFITSSTSTYSSLNYIGGYVGYWERVLTPTEIAENQTWREQIWNVAP